MEYCFFSVFLFSFLSLCIFDVQDFWNIVFLQVLLGCFFLVFSSFLNFCMFDVQEFGNIGHLRVFSKFFGFCMFSSMECFPRLLECVILELLEVFVCFLVFC